MVGPYQASSASSLDDVEADLGAAVACWDAVDGDVEDHLAGLGDHMDLEDSHCLHSDQACAVASWLPGVALDHPSDAAVVAG